MIKAILWWKRFTKFFSSANQVDCQSLSLAPVNRDWFYMPGFTFPVPAHPGSPRQNPRGLWNTCACVHACQSSRWKSLPGLVDLPTESGVSLATVGEGGDLNVDRSRPPRYPHLSDSISAVLPTPLLPNTFSLMRLIGRLDDFNCCAQYSCLSWTHCTIWYENELHTLKHLKHQNCALYLLVIFMTFLATAQGKVMEHIWHATSLLSA